MKRTKEFRKSLFVTVMFLIMCCMMLLPSIDVNAAQVKLSTNTVTLNVGQSKTIKMKGTSKKVKWSTNKPKVATVSSKGKIKAVGQGTATVTAKVGKKSYKCKVLVYQTSSGDAEVDKKVRSIINNNITAKMSDAEKVKAIHDYIILNCEYGESSIGDGTNIGYVKKFLYAKKIKCLGYSNTFKYFLDILNIPCKTICGYAGGGHAWNMVKIGNNWYNVDVTWDDLGGDMLSYEYFLVPNSKMPERTWESDFDMSPYDEYELPVATASSKEFVSVIAPISKNTKQAANNLYSDYKKGKKFFTIAVPNKVYQKNNNFINDTLGLFFTKANTYCVTYTYDYHYDSYVLISISLTR